MPDTLITDLRAAILNDATLAASLSTRVYPEPAPQSAVTPFLVYTEVSLFTDQDLSGTNGNREKRVQFDFYTSTKSQGHDLREALLAEFDGLQGTIGSSQVQHISLEGTSNSFDTEDRLYRYQVEFIIHYII